ncbi:MAG: hypothetical protein Ct9H90mP13_08920 [Pseudomonadota bacterium]|nr:MAG: hypothetical protein Ct9H90mP13_08920 [Pseudomonadota bacterium]
MPALHAIQEEEGYISNDAFFGITQTPLTTKKRKFRCFDLLR